MPIIQSLDRALRMLDLFDETTTELKITEISERMQLHKSTVHSLLATLKMHGYIDQNAETGKYRLGLKLMERGQLVLHSTDLRDKAHPLLTRLAGQTGQTAHLVVLDGRDGVYIDKVEGERAVIRYSRIGRRVPLHSSATGKVLAASLSEAELKPLLSGYVYIVHTDRTLRTEAAFRQELALVREQGYAIDREENERGVQCMAVPVRNHAGRVIAALSLSMLAGTVTQDETEDYIRRLRDSADQLSAGLGWSASKR